MFRYIETVIVTVFVLLFIFPSQVSAVTIEISNYPQIVNSDIFTVDVQISGATNARNYLRVDLYQDKEGDKNYFGETYNGSDWYNGADGKKYFPVDIVNASASATIQAQIGNPNITDYPGPGPYKLRIRRYTASGSSAQNDTQNLVDVQISWSTPSPTPSPVITPGPTSQPTAEPTVLATKSPTIKPIATKSPTPKPSSSPTSKPTQSATVELKPLESGIDILPTPSGLVAGSSTQSKKVPVVATIFVFSGLGFMLVGIGGLYLKVKRQYNMESEKTN